jgi:predicted nucleic acid-binding protein
MAGDPRGGQVTSRVIHYLLDSSALWRILREADIREGWAGVISDHGIGSCHPQRAEFRRSARDTDEYEQMSGMFDELFPDISLPKGTWQWIESAQYRLVRAGVHRAFSCVDLLLCAAAALHGLVILHDDNDFAAAAGHLTDLSQRQVRMLPGEPEA